jgi:DNA-binding MarR family transcriptional regulator
MPQPDERPPVVFMLYVAFQKSGQLVAEALAGTGIVPVDAPIYNQLERRGPLTPTELAEALGIGASTLTYRMRGLVDRGHLVREANPNDGRSALVRLTPSGLRAWRRALPDFVTSLRAAEDRLEIPQREVGRALAALASALDAELAERSAGLRRAS